VQTPKFLHRHRPATSALSDFSTGTFFNRVIDDGKGSDNTRHLARDCNGRPYLDHPDKIARVILCCGQIYYHLSNARRNRKIANIVLVRLEQIAPFPHDIVLRVLRQYPNAELVWCQEEPKNQGAWGYVRCDSGMLLETLSNLSILPRGAERWQQTLLSMNTSVICTLYSFKVVVHYM
jgi:2-oxoglutarate dehydrogenase E1 component